MEGRWMRGVWALAAWSAAARCQPDEQESLARALFEQAVELRTRGDLEGAAASLRRSRHIRLYFSNTFELISVLSELGHWDEALAAYDELLEHFSDRLNAEQRAQLQAVLLPRGVPIRVTTSITGRLLIDGRERGEVRSERVVHLTPGMHQVVLNVEGYGPVASPLEVKAGQPVLVALRPEKQIVQVVRLERPRGLGMLALEGAALWSPTLHGDASQGCEASCGALGGAALLRASYRFPWRLQIDAGGGWLAASSSFERSATAALAGSRYQLHHRPRLAGAVVFVGVGYAMPLSERLEVLGRLSAWISSVRSDDRADGELIQGASRERVAVAHAGEGERAVQGLLVPEVGLGWRVSRWRLGAGVGVGFALASGPRLPNGETAVVNDPPRPCASGGGELWCVRGRDDVAGNQRAYGPFWGLLPSLSLAATF